MKIPEDLRKLNSADLGHAIKIAGRTWWVGHSLPGDIFKCHVYLIENGNESVLIDPGGYLTFNSVFSKVSEITPFSNIRYFICHHQDPDITGILKHIDNMAGRHKDAVIVTHWRARELIKHFDLLMPFWEIDEHGWQLDLGDRKLKFIFTPYLHFPGAFCTFDPSTGVLFSSDLFGGMVSEWSLVAKDASYFESIRPFHEHYMPSREILALGLSKLEKNPVRIIAPQHGSIIPEDLVSYMFSKLKQIDCGIYSLASDKSDIKRLSLLNKTLRDITNTVVLYRDFEDIAKALLEITNRTLPVTSIEFYARLDEGNALHFSAETRFRGVIAGPPVACKDMVSVNRNDWFNANSVIYRKVLLPSNGKGAVSRNCIIIPLFSYEGGNGEGAAILCLKDDSAIDNDTELMLRQMSLSIGVAIEREAIYRMIEMERGKLYERSIRDPLTGLYNRLYMDEAVKRLMYIQDRNDQPLSLALIDLDHFKKINDTYGHDAGDEVLRKVGATLASSVRGGDIPVRLGGEEFAVFLIGNTLEGCVKMAEKIRQRISDIPLEGKLKGCRITASVGVAERFQNEPLAELIKKADLALYQAKNEGRNRVVCAQEAA